MIDSKGISCVKHEYLSMPPPELSSSRHHWITAGILHTYVLKTLRQMVEETSYQLSIPISLKQLMRPVRNHHSEGRKEGQC